MKGIPDEILIKGAWLAAADISDMADSALDELFCDRADPMSFFRATGEQDGEALFVFFARRKVLTVNEDAWPKLPEKTKAFFDVFARVAYALVKETPARERAEMRVVAAPKRRIQDTIFEKGGSIGEKIGRGELSAGQPTSTAQVRVEHPAADKPGDPFAQFGGKNPGEWTEEEKLAFAARLGKPAASEATDRMVTTAPDPAAKFKARNVRGFIDGEAVEGQVFVSSPFEPKPMAADDEDEA